MKTNLLVFIFLLIGCAIYVTKGHQGAAQEVQYATVEVLPQDFTDEPKPITPELLDRTLRVIESRLEAPGGLLIQGNNEILVPVEDEAEFERLEQLLSEQGKLEFCEHRYDEAAGQKLWFNRMDGTHFLRAIAQPQDGAWMIAFELDEPGRESLANLTQELLGRPLGIFFDGVEISVPVINTPIKDGKGIISGSFSRDEAERLARYLRSGALPLRCRVLASPFPRKP